MKLISFFITCTAWVTISFFPMWRNRNRNRAKAVVLIAALFLLGGSLWIIFTRPDYYRLQQLKISGFFVYLPLTFFLYRGYAFQCLFLTAVSAMYQTAILGLGVFVEEVWGGLFSAAYPMVINNCVSIAMSLLILPFLLRMLRQIFRIVGVNQSEFWRLIWIIPMLFFMMSMLSGDGVYGETTEPFAYVAIRLLMTGAMLFVCYLLSTVLKAEVRSAEAVENTRMMELQLDLQREQYDLLWANMEQARTARHDLRQHMSVIRSFLEAKEYDKMEQYLSEYLSSVSMTTEEPLSRNHAVNALTRYYFSMAKEEGVTTKAELEIPERAGRIPDIDLCIVVGNFLENALEACRRVTQGRKFITMKAKVQNDYLTIVVDNSFDGMWREEKGIFYSRKHKGEGIGLSSVRAIAKKYDGNALFKGTGLVFQSSVVLKMQEQEEKN